MAKGYGERVPRTINRNYRLNGTVVLDSGAVLTEPFIGNLPNTQIKELAHQLNRRTEFTVLRNDFVPKQKLDTVVVPRVAKIDIVVDPEAEKHTVDLIYDAKGRYGVRCEVNGYPLNVYVDPTLREPVISLSNALNLLRDGAISKDDFAGDPEEVLANASIIDGAVFLVEEVRIEREFITMIEVKVIHKLEDYGFYLDQATFSQLGEFEIDEENKQLILK